MNDLDLDNIEAAALGRTGVGIFAHPKDTLLLVAEIRRLRELLPVVEVKCPTCDGDGTNVMTKRYFDPVMSCETCAGLGAVKKRTDRVQTVEPPKPTDLTN